MDRRDALALIAALAATPALAGAPATAPLPVPRRTPAPPGPETILARHAASGIAGWALRDLDTGRMVEAHQASHAFVPASVAKLPTAFYALETLGPGHRFATRLLASGPVEDGVLQGDLCLSGGGDPELDTDALLPLAQALADRGIRRIAGRFLIDSTCLPYAQALEDEQPADAAYNPSVSGLMLNYNRVRLHWDMRGKRREALLTAEATRLNPPVPAIGLTIEDRRDVPVYVHTVSPGHEEWRIRRNALRNKGARWLPVRHIVPYAGAAFAALAQTYGIALPGALPGTAAAGATEIARHESRPLELILRDMLRYSTNLTAEAVGLAATRHLTGQVPGSLAASARMMNTWAAQLSGGAAPAFANHSGLSLSARVTPENLTAMIAGMAARSAETGGATKALPAPMADLLTRKSLQIRGGPRDPRGLEIVAKTGTMTYVRGLAGMVATPDGRRLAFAIFSNDLPRRSRAARDRAWTGRAVSFERALLGHWSNSDQG